MNVYTKLENNQVWQIVKFMIVICEGLNLQFFYICFALKHISFYISANLDIIFHFIVLEFHSTFEKILLPQTFVF